MITSNALIEMDEQTEIGIIDPVNGPYVQLNGNAISAVLSESEVLMKYIERGVRVPEQFVGIRQKLQAIL